MRGRTVMVVTAALVAGTALGGCSGSDDDAAAPTTPSVTVSRSTPSLTASSPTASSPTSPTSPAATVTTTSRPTAAGSVKAAWPKALGEPQQGDPVWAVYLAVAHRSEDPDIDAAIMQAAKVGYQAVVGDIACDGGAMEALKLDQFDYWSTAAVYFRTEREARGFAAAYARDVSRPRGVVHVKVGCLD